MIVGIVGSPDFSDYEYLESELNEVHQIKNISGIVIASNFRRVKSQAPWLAHLYATKKHIPCRKTQLLTNECDVLVAFWDGQSKAVLNNIEEARKLNKKVIINQF